MPNPLQCGHTRLHEGCAICLRLQTEWYQELEAAGFEEIECVAVTGRPLRVWTGVSIQVTPKGCDEPMDVLDLIVRQEAGEAIGSSFPESHLTEQERLLYHPDFDDLCGTLCSHGNHQLTASQVRSIWLGYLGGSSNRCIGSNLGINHSLVWRTINALTQWVALMDMEETQDAPLAKVVLREYRQLWDQPFVFASWRNCLWYDDDNREEGQADRFYRQATKSIRTFLDSKECRVRIACVDGVPDHIVGYSVTTGDCLQFVYVKADYRNKGIGTLLVPKDVARVSQVQTKIGRAIAVKKKFTKENVDGTTSKE